MICKGVPVEIGHKENTATPLYKLLYNYCSLYVQITNASKLKRLNKKQMKSIQKR